MRPQNDIDGGLPAPAFITVRGAARRAGVGLRQLERAIDAGHLPAYQVGGWRRVKWTDVTSWLAACLLKPEPRE
jgi:excisionase family DNA binding protein